MIIRAFLTCLRAMDAADDMWCCSLCVLVIGNVHRWDATQNHFFLFRTTLNAELIPHTHKQRVSRGDRGESTPLHAQ